MVNAVGFADGFIPGLNGNGWTNIPNLFEGLNSNDYGGFNQSIITNITGTKAIDFIAQDWWFFLTKPGSQPHIFIKKGLTSIAETGGHGAGQMMDTMVIMDDKGNRLLHTVPENFKVNNRQPCAISAL